MRLPATLFALVGATVLSSAAMAQGQPSARGIWITEGGKSQVEVSDCGAGLCAKIISLKQPNDARGKPLVDGNNPTASQRLRPILGLPLFENMRRGSAGWEGRIYNPEEGQSFDVTVRLAGPNQLTIKGCVLIVCETHVWQRAAATERTDASPVARSATPAKAAQ